MLSPIYIEVVATRRKGLWETHGCFSLLCAQNSHRRVLETVRPLRSVYLVIDDVKGKSTEFFHKNCIYSQINNDSDFRLFSEITNICLLPICGP